MSVYVPAYTAADLQAPPTDRSAGIPIGWDYPDPWRLQVELFTSPNGALWSEAASPAGKVTAVWGTSVWAESPAWRDITADVTGLDWTRGADQRNGRPRTGVLNVDLRNRDGRYSPANRDGALYMTDDYRPGTLIRVSVVCEDDTTFADGWIPQFTGIVESWIEETIGMGAVSTVRIVAVETTAFLAKIDDDELGTPAGADDRVGERLGRLLDRARALSTFGFIDNYTAAYEDPVYGGFYDYLYHLQATTMAQNRLAECYLTVDSMRGTVFRSDRSGAFLLEYPWYTAFNPATARDFPQLTDDLNGGIENLLVVFTPAQHTLDDRARPVYEPDTIVVRNDDEGIINRVTVDIVGGSSPNTLSDEESIGRDGLRPFARYDFISVDKSSVKTTYIQTDTRRLEQVTVHNLNQKSDRAIGALVGLDFGHHVFVELDTALRFYDIDDDTDPQWTTSNVQGPVARCRVRGMRHRVIPMNNGLCKWTADFQFDPINHAIPVD